MVEARNQKNRLECDICMAEYQVNGDHYPVSLPCGHPICQSCANLLFQQEVVSQGKDFFTCPTCREEIPANTKLSKCIGIIKMMEMMEESKSPQMRN